MKNKDLQSFFLSVFLHGIFVMILYFFGLPKEFKINDTHHEIIDADIVGIVNQSKTNDVKIEEKIVKKELLPQEPDIEKTIKDEKTKKEKKQEIDEMTQENQKEEIQKEKAIKEIVEENENKKNENKKNESKNDSQKENDPIKTIDEKKIEEKKIDERKTIEKQKPKEDKIKSVEAKKIEDILKKVEKKNELDELKKSLNKANKALKNFENEKKNIINKNIQSNDQIGGGDVATAKIASYIKSQIIACWKIPPLIGVEAEKIFVILRIKLDKNGNIVHTKIVNEKQYGNSQFFNIISESAVKAANICSPIKNLPQDKYDGDDGWKEVELVFDPSKFIS